MSMPSQALGMCLPGWAGAYLIEGWACVCPVNIWARVCPHEVCAGGGRRLDIEVIGSGLHTTSVVLSIAMPVTNSGQSSRCAAYHARVIGEPQQYEHGDPSLSVHDNGRCRRGLISGRYSYLHLDATNTTRNPCASKPPMSPHGIQTRDNKLMTKRDTTTVTAT